MRESTLMVYEIITFKGDEIVFFCTPQRGQPCFGWAEVQFMKTLLLVRFYFLVERWVVDMYQKSHMKGSCGTCCNKKKFHLGVCWISITKTHFGPFIFCWKKVLVCKSEQWQHTLLWYVEDRKKKFGNYTLCNCNKYVQLWLLIVCAKPVGNGWKEGSWLTVSSTRCMHASSALPQSHLAIEEDHMAINSLTWWTRKLWRQNSHGAL
jgi:hypothetical protein